MPPGPLLFGDPQQLAGYRLEGRLGEGGQGTVFLGRDRTGRPVAVKLLRAALLDDPAARARFVHELAAAQQVARFCTAQVLDADLAGDRPYIVSEYVDGPSLLQQVTAAGPREGAELERLAIGTATALAAIHEAGVVHCDLKPANVLLAGDGPRVIDFGIARALDVSGSHSQVIGTPAYMAPEQMSSSAVSPAADVFSWGATIAFAMNGRSPFLAGTPMETMYRVLHAPPELGRLTGPLRRLVGRCLVKDADDRPSSREVLLELLGTRDWVSEPPRPGGEDSTVEIRTEQMLTWGTRRAAEAAGTTAVPADTVAQPPPTRALPNGPVVGDQAPARRRGGRRIAVLVVAAALVAGGVVGGVALSAGGQRATAVPDAFAGQWSGSGRLPLEGTTVSPQVVLTAGSVRTELSAGESSCASGTLEFRSADSTTLEMDFRPPNAACPAGTMTFVLTAPDRLDMHLGPDPAATYYATLTR